jgi:restriction endonuclease S subunit
MPKRLKDIAEIQLGYQAREKMRPDADGSHGVIQIKDVTEDDAVDFSGLVRIRPEREPERYEVREGDVLFISRGNRLRAAAVAAPPLPTMAVSFFYILRPDPASVLPAYLSWAINQPDVQAQVQRAAMGTGIPHIRRKPVENLLIHVPPLDIQRRILRVSELMRRERNLAERLLDKRQELATAICLGAAKRTL